MIDAHDGNRVGVISTALLFLLLADAALETFWSGSPVRWWVVGAVVVYAVASAFVWKRATWSAAGATSLLALMAIVALTAWLPGGLTNGVRVVGLSTATVLSLTCSAGIALATSVLVRQPWIRRQARWIVVALGTYGVAAFLQAAITGTPFPALLAGQSLWRGLPYVLQGVMIGGLVVLPLGLLVSAVRAGLRAPVPGSTARSIRQAAALAAAFAIVVAAVPNRKGPVVSSPQLAASGQMLATGGVVASPERLAALENSFRAIEDGLRESARDRWDPDYVIQRVGSDPQQLFDWVRDNTHWIPYQGVLRGPVGVLNDRLGSSLDRALLLATLLQKAGHSVRLANAELTSGRAVEMLPGLTVSRRMAALGETIDLVAEPAADYRETAGNYQLAPEAIDKTIAAQTNELHQVLAELEARVADQSERLLSLIDRPGPAAAQVQARDRAAGALRSHWWVQRQAGAEWLDVDLLGLLPDEGPPPAAHPTFEIQAIPGAEYHELSVRVVVERWAPGGVLTEQRAFEHVLRPADLIGRPVILRLWPNQWPGDIDAVAPTRHRAVRVAALEVSEWTAALMVNRDVVAQATIRADGAVPPPPRGGQLGGLGSALRQALGGEDRGRPASELTSAWFEYEIRSPGAPSRVVRRSVFDALGPDRRANPPSHFVLDEAQKVIRSLSLMMETEILPIACGFAPEFLLHLAAQSLLANRAVLRLAASGESIDDSIVNEEFIRSLERLPTPLYSLAAARLAWSRFQDEIYIDRPGLLTRHVFLRPVKDAMVWTDATDIVGNEIGVDIAAEDPFVIRLEQGVLDTNAEALLTRGVVVGNTGAAFASSTEWIALASDDQQRLTALALPDDVRRRIGEDLSSGHTVVAPALPVQVGAEQYVGWWRVDEETGHTLGVDTNGWGASFAEYAKTFMWAFATELVVCSAMHEFVAVARDGAGWGSGTWMGLGTCVAAALAAGVLATLWLVVMTVSPRLFFRTWRSGPPVVRPPGFNKRDPRGAGGSNPAGGPGRAGGGGNAGGGGGGSGSGTGGGGRGTGGGGAGGGGGDGRRDGTDLLRKLDHLLELPAVNKGSGPSGTHLDLDKPFELGKTQQIPKRQYGKVRYGNENPGRPTKQEVDNAKSEARTLEDELTKSVAAAVEKSPSRAGATGESHDPDLYKALYNDAQQKLDAYKNSVDNYLDLHKRYMKGPGNSGRSPAAGSGPPPPPAPKCPPVCGNNNPTLPQMDVHTRKTVVGTAGASSTLDPKK
jgi:hypothetical protein